MADLRTDYKDDVLNINTNERRKYRMIPNADGTVSFEDVTDYAQNGDSFGANDVNTITERVNRSLTGDDVVDNLESTETKLPLSSNMGRVLKEIMFTPPNYSNKIYTTTDVNSTYTATENCWVFGQIEYNSGTLTSFIYVDGSFVLSTKVGHIASGVFPVAKGQTISFRDTGAIYSIQVYSCL